MGLSAGVDLEQALAVMGVGGRHRPEVDDAVPRTAVDREDGHGREAASMTMRL